MNKMKVYIIIVACFLLQTNFVRGQENLDAVLQKVLNKSFASRSASTQKAIAKSGFDFYESQLRPNVGLRASLPNYSKTSSPILQPDGTILFRSIRQANSSVSLFATQVLTSTLD